MALLKLLFQDRKSILRSMLENLVKFLANAIWNNAKLKNAKNEINLAC